MWPTYMWDRSTFRGVDDGRVVQLIFIIHHQLTDTLFHVLLDIQYMIYITGFQTLFHCKQYLSQPRNWSRIHSLGVERWQQTYFHLLYILVIKQFMIYISNFTPKCIHAFWSPPQNVWSKCGRDPKMCREVVLSGSREGNKFSKNIIFTETR